MEHLDVTWLSFGIEAEGRASVIVAGLLAFSFLILVWAMWARAHPKSNKRP